ncbi:GumC family protein [Tellurirhabdus bombi]|uniref:GumC family protein n=1 Tax=Tellurirhabdus bombi TaxID=2907205 RepID=UPI001F463C1D|nr:tyrosine-protein kinase [Tellurirhabdus bombi]
MNGTSSYIYDTKAVYNKEEQFTSDLQNVLSKYLRNWKWFVLSVLVMLVIGYIYSQTTEPVYRIQASLLVKDQQKGLSEKNILKEMDFFTPSRVVENEIEIIQSFTLMQKAVDKLGLDVRYYHQKTFRKQEIYDASPIRLVAEKPLPSLYKKSLQIEIINPEAVRIEEATYPVNQSIETPYGRLRIVPKRALIPDSEPILVKVMPRHKAAQQYQKNLTVETSSKASTVLLVTLEDPVVRKGEHLLNQLLKEYNAAEVTDKNRVVTNTLDFIEKRLGLVSTELADIEGEIERFKSANKITNISAEAQALLQKVQGTDIQLSQVEIQISVLADLERYVHAKASNPGMVPATLGLSDPTLIAQIGRAAELELRREQIARTTSDSHPFLRTIDEQIRATKSNIRETVGTMRIMLTSSRQQLLAKNAQHENQIRVVPGKERALMSITRQQVIKNNLYTYLLQKREETALSHATTVSDTRTIDLATSDDVPIKPIKSLIFLLFGSLGLLIPIAFIWAKDIFSKLIAQRIDIDSATHAPVIAEISHTKHKNAVVVSNDNRSETAEQIRALRTNIQLLRSNEKNMALLITSSISGEGKSFISLNLGASLALINRPTVLLEMDLRRPKIHSMLGVPNGIGLSDYLAGHAELDDILHPVPNIPYYWVITCGKIPTNPSELLTNTRMEELFARLREIFAYILVDAPPIGLVTDAQIIADHTDASLYVIRYNLTPKQALRKVETLYREQRLRKLSLVLNAADTQSTYGYGNQYYQELESEKSGVLDLFRGRLPNT